MSALVSSQGAVFVSETATRSASAAGAFLTETAVNYVDLAGAITPSVSFGGDLTAGVFSPVVLLVHCDGTNGSTTFVDTSPSAHTLTPTAVTVATGNPKFGTGSASLAFSNLASSISVGGNASDFWFDSGPFTMEAWCYATQAPGWDGYSILFAEWGAALSNLNFWFSAFPTLMFFWSFDGVTYDFVDAGVGCPLNAWTHIAADRDASGTLRVYLNGAVVASRSISGSFFHSTFTCQVGNDNTLGRPFPGYLDEIRVTKGVAQYGGAFTPPTAAFPDPGAPPTVDLAGNLTVSTAFAADLAPLRDLIGDLAVSTTLAADVTSIHDFGGALVPTVSFAANLTVASAIPPWTPADLGAGLLLWLDAADASTVTVTGSGVSQWRDKSGNARHANQATDANRPPYVSGQAVQMLDQKALTPVAGYPSAYDFVLAGKTYGTGIYRNWANTVSAHFPMVIANGLDRIGVFTTGFFQAGIQLWPVNTQGVVYGNVPAGSNESLALNGGSLVATTSFATNAVINAFGRSGTAQGFGDVYEACLVAVNASLDTKQRLEGYLAWKWGFQALLPPTHPYAGAPPTQPQFDDLAGDIVPSVVFAADLDVVEGPRNYVDFSGNLGGPSLYGAHPYGKAKYSRYDAIAPFFSALLGGPVNFAGDLAPPVTFVADLSLDIELAGGMAPQIALGGDLGADRPLEGNISLRIDLGASSLISEPLWGVTEPCPTPPWTASEPCPPSMWTPVPPPTFTPLSGGWTKQEEDDDVSVWGDAT